MVCNTRGGGWGLGGELSHFTVNYSNSSSQLVSYKSGSEPVCDGHSKTLNCAPCTCKNTRCVVMHCTEKLLALGGSYHCKKLSTVQVTLSKTERIRQLLYSAKSNCRLSFYLQHLWVLNQSLTAPLVTCKAPKAISACEAHLCRSEKMIGSWRLVCN